MRLPFKALAFALLLVLGLAGCSGGGDDSSAEVDGWVAEAEDTPAPPPDYTQSGLEPFALDASSFELQRASAAAMREEIWRATNTETTARKVRVEFSDLKDRDLVYVFANPTSEAVARPADIPTLRGKPRPSGRGQHPAIRAPGPEPFDHVQVSPGTGELKEFYNESSRQYLPTTMTWQTQAPDGRAIRLWVGESAPGLKRLTDSDARQFLQQIAVERGVYSLVTSVIGPIAGPVSGSLVLAHPDGNAPLDIVLADINAGTTKNRAGFFASGNYYRKLFWRHSSESVAVFLDLKNTYSEQRDGLNTILTLFAHELAHAAVYEYRVTQRGMPSFDHWVNEMMAMLVAGLASNRIASNFNDFGQGWWPHYVAKGHHVCQLDVDDEHDHAGDCSVYSVTSAFAEWGIRQMGLPWIQALLDQKDPGREGVARAIESASFGRLNWESAFVAWSATAGGLYSKGSRPYGFPELQATAPDGGQIVSAAVRAPYYVESRALPDVAAIASNALFITENHRVSGYFMEWVEVPPGTTLTVLVR